MVQIPSRLGRVVVVACTLIAGPLQATAATPQGSPLKRGSAKTENPGEILRKRAAGADGLEVETVAIEEDEKKRTLLTVKNKAEIAQLLELVETPEVETGTSSSHGCFGFPKMRFTRKGKLLAEISFDHSHMLRPYSKGLWSVGDADLTDSSARSMARWFADRGLDIYQKEIDGEDRQRESWNAFRQEFPPMSREFLSKEGEWGGLGMVAFGGSRNPSTPPDCGTKVVEPLFSEIPDPVQRVRTIFRALGHLVDDWNGYPREQAITLAWANCIATDQLARAVQAAAGETLELNGAARALFGAPADIFERLEPAMAERLALQVIPAVMAMGNPRNSREMPLVLARFKSQPSTALLTKISEHIDEVDDSNCEHLGEAAPALNALVVLARRDAASAETIKKASARVWSCTANQTAANIAAALSAHRLPSEDDLKEAGLTAALLTLARLKENPTREAEQLVRKALLEHKLGLVRQAAKEWLALLPAR